MPRVVTSIVTTANIIKGHANGGDFHLDLPKIKKTFILSNRGHLFCLYPRYGCYRLYLSAQYRRKDARSMDDCDYHSSHLQ